MNNLKFHVGDIVRFCDDEYTRGSVRMVDLESLLDIDLTISECDDEFDSRYFTYRYRIQEDKKGVWWPKSFLVFSGTDSELNDESDSLSGFLSEFQRR